MSKSGRSVLERALKLPMSERAELAQEILDSLDEAHSGEIEIDPRYRKELVTRALEEPAPGKRWPTAREVVTRIRRELDKPVRKRSKKRGA
jgi:hypothetical protein